jgi:hypothetical protein
VVFCHIDLTLSPVWFASGWSRIPLSAPILIHCEGIISKASHHFYVNEMNCMWNPCGRY